MNNKEGTRKDGLLTELEMEIYRKPQCSGKELEKIKRFHNKLNISQYMTLKGMYLIFHEELRVLNLDKIHDLEQLCIKSKKYRRYLKSKKNKAKLKKEGGAIGDKGNSRKRIQKG